MNNTPPIHEQMLDTVRLIEVRRQHNVRIAWMRRASALIWLFSNTSIFLLAKRLSLLYEPEGDIDQWLMVLGILTSAWVTRTRACYADFWEAAYKFLKSCWLPAAYMTALWFAWHFYLDNES